MILLFVAAVILRVTIHVVFADDLVFGSDQVDYVTLGQHLTDGNAWGVLDTYWPPLLPVLIGSVSLFIDGPTLPSIIVAVIAGSLIVPATYYLARQSYDHHTAAIAAGLALIYPHLLNAVFAAGSENVYVFLIVACLISGWKAVTSESLKYCVLTGGLLGLAYLTRPEAFAYPSFFIGFILFRSWSTGTRFRTALVRSGALLIAFLVLATPYLFYLRGETGRWTISSKSEINTVMVDYSDVAEADDEGVVAGPAATVETFTVVIKLVAVNLVQISKALPTLIPLPVVMFMALGLFAAGWSRERVTRESYLILFCLLTFLGYAVAVVQTRYFYILLPIFLGWTAKGIVAFGIWLKQTAEKSTYESLGSLAGSRHLPAFCIAFLLLFLLPLNFFMSTSETAWRSRPYEERAAGMWLRSNAEPNARVFSARKLPAFYAGAVQVPPTSAEFEEVFRKIREDRVEYVVVGQRELKRNPYLNDLEPRMKASPDFELVYTNTDHPDYKISVFKRK